MTIPLPELRENPQIGLVDVNLGWVIEGVNATSCRLLGFFNAEEAIGTELRQWLDGIEASAGGRDGGGAAALGVVVKRAGFATAVDIATTPRRAGEAGLVQVGWTVSITDASARVLAEAEVVRLRARLSEVERARGRLAALQEEAANVALDGEAAESGGGVGGVQREVMVGASAPLRRVKEQIAKVAGTSATVLIHGETGAGKELVARSIHHLSNRRGQAFVAVNCAAMPESLIESELFGHERGAFTGADRRRAGKFELADSGTLFLDEIAELPLQAQAKLLRVLQDGAFERVGGMETLKVDVRLVVATHRDLARQVERGRFREDLFYRLNVFRIVVPPLRDRKEDLVALAEHLHERIARRMGRRVLKISERSIRRMVSYGWPGNVRELANAVERATLLAEGDELEIELPESPLRDMPGAMLPRSPGEAGRAAGAPTTRDILLDLTLEQLQRLHITHALESCEYRVFGEDGAAGKLDINPYTLLSRMDKYGIPRPRLMSRERRKGGADPSV